jgi:hypothetical protein
MIPTKKSNNENYTDKKNYEIELYRQKKVDFKM